METQQADVRSSCAFRGRLAVSCSLLWGFGVVPKGTENGHSQLFQTIWDSGYIGWLETTCTHTGKLPETSHWCYSITAAVWSACTVKASGFCLIISYCKFLEWLQTFQLLPPFFRCMNDLLPIPDPLQQAFSQRYFYPLSWWHMLMQLQVGTDTWYLRVSCSVSDVAMSPHELLSANKKMKASLTSAFSYVVT